MEDHRADLADRVSNGAPQITRNLLNFSFGQPGRLSREIAPRDQRLL